jgi:uncharacterized Zn finger protein
MDFTCSHCGNNSFKILGERRGSQDAKCLKCGKVTAFAADNMTLRAPKIEKAEPHPDLNGKRLQ